MMTKASFDIFGPTIPQSPVVVSVPHAGRDYPDGASLLRYPLDRLRPLEDRYADELCALAVAAGASTIVSRLPRLWIDLNRAESDLDPAMLVGRRGSGVPPTARMRGGLGLIPRRLGDLGDVWRADLTPEDVARRVAGHYRPYHAALSAMLTRAHARFGAAMLVDVHSMPPLGGSEKPVIVLGDRFGATCAPQLVALVDTIFTHAGYAVGANAPYAGGHIIGAHADRARNIHALQVEIDRSLYLDADFDRTGPGLPAVQVAIAAIIASLGDRLTRPVAIAAE